MGCISKEEPITREPIVNGWTFGFSKDTLSADEIKNNMNKECVEKEQKTGSVDINLRESNRLEMDPKKVKLCVCDDKELCNVATSTRFCGMTLILIGILSMLL